LTGKTLEPFAFAGLRKAMGLSVVEMAELVGLDGDNASDRIREMERGKRMISGPLQRMLRYLAQAVDVGGAGAIGLPTQLLPRWLDCKDLAADKSDVDIIMHTRWPRFFGWISSDMPESLAAELNAAGIPVVPMNLGQLSRHIVVLFVDEPVGDTQVLIDEGVRLKQRRS
jgi:transcriptional regulator with XRE-family HTH domain